MQRRRFILASATALGAATAGCLGGQQSPSDGDGTPTGQPPTSDPESPSSPTPTPTPVPDSCGSPPDIEGLPAWPDELTEETVRSYVTEFERVYAVTTKSEYGAIADLHVTHTETGEDRYRVQLAVDGIPPTPTTGPDGETPTEIPPDGTAHRALYRLGGDRMVRELRGYAGGGVLSTDCWSVADSVS